MSVAPYEPSLETGPQPRAPEPTPQGGSPGEPVSMLDWLGSVERESQTGKLVKPISDWFSGAKDEDVPYQADPSYNFIDHVPAEFMHDYGHRYVGTWNEAQAAEVTRQIKEEQQSQRMIASYGTPGKVAAFAMGMTDPLNIASMALVPEAAPTRIGNAVRWAITNGLASGGLEALHQEQSPTATTREGLLNVGAGAVLGGLLGPLAPRVPHGAFNKLAEDLGLELHPPAATAPELGVPTPGVGALVEPEIPEPSRVLGPEQRTVADQLDGMAQALHEYGFEGGVITPQEERARPQYVPPRPEGPTPPRPGVTPEIEPHRMSLGEAVAVTKGAESRSFGLSYNEALAQGLDPAALDAARFGSRRVFTKGGASFDEMAGILSQHGYPVVDEMGRYSPNALLDSLDLELRGKKQYSTAAGDYLSQILEHEKASEAADRAAPPGEEDLEREAQIQAAKQAEKEAQAEVDPHALPGEPMYVNPEMESTAGAMAVRGGSLADLTVARGGQTYAKTIGKAGIAGRLMEASSAAVRRLTLGLLNHPGTLEGSYRDIRVESPVERDLWKEVEAKQAAAISNMNDNYRAYVQRVKTEGGPLLRRSQFEAEWAHAMRNGDRSQIPEVAAAAKWHRENVYKPWHERAQAAGMLDKEQPQLFAESYLTRLYDQRKIGDNRSAWLDLLTRNFAKQGVEPAEAAMIAHDVSRNVGAGERGTLDMHALDGIVPKSGRTKARALAMPDNELEPFLVNDHARLVRAYLHTIVPEVLMTERFGTRDLADQFQEIRDEYAHMIELKKGDDPGINALVKERDSNIKLLEAARDLLYGNYAVPKDPGSFMVRAGRDLRALNVGRMLGGATFKHFPDLANVIQRFGAPQTFAVMSKLATSLDAAKMGYREAKRMSAAIDIVMNTSSSRLWDAPPTSQFWEQRLLSKFNRFFTMATLETPLITGIQTLSAVAAHDEILRTAERVAAGRMLPKNLGATLAAAGLDTGMLERIAVADARHGRVMNGLRFGMSDQWADKEAARAFESAIARDAHGVTMRPGIGDKPLFMSKEWGKFIFQFKSFEFAASRIVGLPMLQGLAHGDARAMQALVAQFAMATAGYVAYQKATGRPVQLDPKHLVSEVLDRTNLMGWTGSVIYPALYAAGFKDLSRWYDKDPVSALGPSAELAKDIYERQLLGRTQQALALGHTAPGQKALPFRRSDEHFIRKMIPGNQLWYFRNTVDKLEDAIGDSFNLPGKSLEDYRKKDEEKRFAENPSIQ